MVANVSLCAISTFGLIVKGGASLLHAARMKAAMRIKYFVFIVPLDWVDVVVAVMSLS